MRVWAVQQGDSGENQARGGARSGDAETNLSQKMRRMGAHAELASRAGELFRAFAGTQKAAEFQNQEPCALKDAGNENSETEIF